MSYKYDDNGDEVSVPKPAGRYITLSGDDGNDFRKIARIMSAAGYAQNHATARNIFVAAMKTFIAAIGTKLNVTLSEERLDEILKNQDVHNAFVDILFMAHKELDEESTDTQGDTNVGLVDREDE